MRMRSSPGGGVGTGGGLGGSGFFAATCGGFGGGLGGSGFFSTTCGGLGGGLGGSGGLQSARLAFSSSRSEASVARSFVSSAWAAPRSLLRPTDGSGGGAGAGGAGGGGSCVTATSGPTGEHWRRKYEAISASRIANRPICSQRSHGKGAAAARATGPVASTVVGIGAATVAAGAAVAAAGTMGGGRSELAASGS